MMRTFAGSMLQRGDEVLVDVMTAGPRYSWRQFGIITRIEGDVLVLAPGRRVIDERNGAYAVEPLWSEEIGGSLNPIPIHAKHLTSIQPIRTVERGTAQNAWVPEEDEY